MLRVIEVTHAEKVRLAGWKSGAVGCGANGYFRSAATESDIEAKKWCDSSRNSPTCLA